MASKDSWFKKLTWGAAREAISGLVWSYWPIIGAPIVMGALSYLNNYPIAIIFILCLSAFAITALGLNNFSQWRAARSPVNKVRFFDPIIGVNLDDTQSPPKVRGIKLGIMVYNVAQFPIEVKLENLETQISDRVPSEGFKSLSLNIGIGGYGRFSNAIIDLSGETLKNTILIGKIKAAVSYGRPGKLKYSLQHQLWVAMKFNNDGQLVTAEPSVMEFENI